MRQVLRLEAGKFFLEVCYTFALMKGTRLPKDDTPANANREPSTKPEEGRARKTP